MAPASTNKNAWKLTLRDNAVGSGRENFDVTTTSVSTTTAGGNISVAYSGAKVGTPTAPEYLSAMLADGSGNVLYYGRLKSIATSADAAGTQDITIPALTAGTYTLKIFNEQYNGDYNTDYSSAIKDVTLTVTTTYAVTYDANGGSGTMANGTATAGVPFTLPACTFTAPTGQQFKEWAIGSTSGAKVAAGSSHTFAAATTVYAVWEAAASAPVNPTVTGPTGNKAITVAVGDTATMSVTATGTAPLTYQWQKSTDGGLTWNNIGTNSASYTTSAVALSNHDYQYRCIATNGSGSVTSPVFTLNVIMSVEIPATGDGNLPGLWLGIALLAMAGLARNIALGRRKRQIN